MLGIVSLVNAETDRQIIIAFIQKAFPGTTEADINYYVNFAYNWLKPYIPTITTDYCLKGIARQIIDGQMTATRGWTLKDVVTIWCALEKQCNTLQYSE